MKRLLLIAIPLLIAATPPPKLTVKRPSVLVAAVTCVAGSNSSLQATFTWTAPTTNADGTPLTLPLTYNVYLGATSGSETKAVSGLTVLSYVKTGLLPNSSLYGYVTAQDANGEGGPSSEVCKSFPDRKSVV